MVFYGASGHGKVIIEAFLESGGEVSGVLDDNNALTRLLQFRVSGSYKAGRFQGIRYVISIGNNCIRKRIAQSIKEDFGTVIHPRSVISTSVAVGAGTVVMAGVIVNADVRVGEHVILNTGCVVDHDCVIEDFAHISPNATICGGVHVGEGTNVGAGATVIQNIRVGKWAIVGAGAVVIEDIPDHAVVIGVPGKIKKYNKPSL